MIHSVLVNEEVILAFAVIPCSALDKSFNVMVLHCLALSRYEHKLSTSSLVSRFLPFLLRRNTDAEGFNDLPDIHANLTSSYILLFFILSSKRRLLYSLTSAERLKGPGISIFLFNFYSNSNFADSAVKLAAS